MAQDKVVKFRWSALFDSPELTARFNEEAKKAAECEGLFEASDRQFFVYVVASVPADGGIYDPQTIADAQRRLVIVTGKEHGTHWSLPDAEAHINEQDEMCHLSITAKNPWVEEGQEDKIVYRGIYVWVASEEAAQPILDAFPGVAYIADQPPLI